MAISMSVLVAVVLGFVALYGGFSFAPGGSTNGATTPTADVLGGFERADRVVDFTPAVPRGVPAEWHPNSFDVTDPDSLPAGALPTVRGGWITPDGRFVTLIESHGALSAVLGAELGAVPAPTARVQAGGADWSVTAGRRAEAAWYREVDGVVYLITGDADPTAFQTVAGSIAT